MSHSDSNDEKRESNRLALLLKIVCTFLGWAITLRVCGRFELARLRAAVSGPVGTLGWFADWNSDTTLVFLVLCMLPLVVVFGIWRQSWAITRRHFSRSFSLPSGTTSPVCRKSKTAAATFGLFLLSFLCSAAIGMRQIEVGRIASGAEASGVVAFCQLPPAYHDEFSYLLQAQTFLAGRLSWPPAVVRPDLFHQIHVLNEPTTASRYFPWTGLWLAPFLQIGAPYLGQWIAGSLACVFFFRSLLKLLPLRWAVVGGILIAVSPGLAVFSNLLLAHHPAMLALSVFLWAFLRLMDSESTRDAAVAGTALALAMLGRPMTAAGFALPFGIWLLCKLPRLRQSGIDRTERGATKIRTIAAVRILLAMGLPLVAGLSFLALMNHQITGKWTESAYQYYTDTWTPSHRFGFNNVEIGSRIAGPKVLRSYDEWATNLTPMKAIENVSNRIIASSQWTLGIGAILFSLIAAVPSCLPLHKNDRRVLLIGCSVISLHMVHIPYWYDGILHWHYVFETAPLLLILTVFGLKNTADALRPIQIPRLTAVWLCALACASLIPNWIDAPSFWGPSRVSLAVGEQSFSRVRFERFRRLSQSAAIRKPCLILVDESGSDMQLSYIVNPPDLEGEVLVCRLPQNTVEEVELQSAFPDRTLYRFDPETFEMLKVEM